MGPTGRALCEALAEIIIGVVIVLLLLTARPPTWTDFVVVVSLFMSSVLRSIADHK